MTSPRRARNRRRPGDVNCAFDQALARCTCGKCFDVMRFEAETGILIEEYG
jgi:hypothetical protein